METATKQIINSIKFDERGLAPVVVYSATTKEVLMLAYVNLEALGQAMESGEAWFWSRSRQELWHKGATSGDRLRIIKVLADCDSDALLYIVEPLGDGACHTTGPDGKKRPSCFFQQL